jgi:predicted DCC family thiol-disulfide oxidoreductase YuxK
MSALLLYDGNCGFCAESVQFVLRHERSADKTLRFASLQSPTGVSIRAQHPELDGIDSVIWYEPSTDQVLVRSRAALRVLRYLGGIWAPLGALGTVVPRFIRDAVYDLIARHRHQLVRGGAACLVPSPEQRDRFLDLTAAGTDASR